MELVVLYLVIAVVTGIVASSRGRSGFGWFVLGCVISIFALILVALLPSTDGQTSGTHVRCPDCQELVLNEARKCKHCVNAG